MRVRHLMSVLAVTLLMACASNGRAEELDLDFELVNSTGYTIKEIYIGPSASKEWGDNIMKKKQVLKDGESLEISFHPKATAKKWDIMVVWDDGDKAEWHGAKLSEIEKITIKWNSKTQEATAVAE